MTLKQQIQLSRDADLIRDLAKYREAIDEARMPEMHPHWNEAIGLIEHEIEQRNLLASAMRGWVVELLDEAPF